LAWDIEFGNYPLFPVYVQQAGVVRQAVHTDHVALAIKIKSLGPIDNANVNFEDLTLLIEPSKDVGASRTLFWL
jgi:hypothetical protein